ncbi:hypothetical protein [Salinimicrobium gaetbulicola]|uniref:Outer membrane protein beta-barrel domain-containing protein n=1 Tax=Salinimicrobium gaetbulicola TaxID=999702 RepID=A0ABW3IFV6_9FLAO
MRKLFLVVLFILGSTGAHAQVVKERSVDVSIGMGISAPYDEYDVIGSGFYAQGEYVLHLASWIDVRAYLGMIIAEKIEDEEKEKGYRSTSSAALFGGKTRITAPIPWFAPYIELGYGASLGSFETYTPLTGKEQSGLLFHFPFTLGVGLGPDHRVNLEFTYYFHDSVQQFSGAAAVGLSIPLK